MGFLGLTLKATHLFKLHKLDKQIEEQRATVETLTTEEEEHASASQNKQEELHEDILMTKQQVAELNESWGVMREMYETSKRMKKMREKALMRKVIGRFMNATLSKCLKEWAALTARRKRLALKHEWQAKVEDLEFEEKSIRKQLNDVGNKLHFVRDKAQADRVRALIARMGFRSLGMWFVMWRAFLKVSADERRADELSSLRQQIKDTEDHSQRLEKKLADQVVADQRMSNHVDNMVAEDVSRHSTVVPAVLEAVVVAERISKRQFAKYPSEARSNGLHDQMNTLRRSGSALTDMRGIVDEVQSKSTTTLPAIESAVPLSPPLPSSKSPAFSPQPPLDSLSVEESIVNDLSTASVDDAPTAPKAHQRSRPFNSRGRTIFEPVVEDARDLGARRDLSLPGRAGVMRASLRRRGTQLQPTPASMGKIDSPRAAVRA